MAAARGSVWSPNDWTVCEVTVWRSSEFGQTWRPQICRSGGIHGGAIYSGPLVDETPKVHLALLQLLKSELCRTWNQLQQQYLLCRLARLSWHQAYMWIEQFSDLSERGLHVLLFTRFMSASWLLVIMNWSVFNCCTMSLCAWSLSSYSKQHWTW